MSEQKTYVPKSSAKEVQFKNGGSILKVGLHVESMIAFLQAHRNESGYVNLGISRRREVGSQERYPLRVAGHLETRHEQDAGGGGNSAQAG